MEEKSKQRFVTKGDALMRQSLLGGKILKRMIHQLAKNADIQNVPYLDATSHPVLCKCEKCLQFWVELVPDDTGSGWSFGPFTEEEFKAGGGNVPPYHLWTTEEERYWQGLETGELDWTNPYKNGVVMRKYDVTVNTNGVEELIEVEAVNAEEAREVVTNHRSFIIGLSWIVRVKAL